MADNFLKEQLMEETKTGCMAISEDDLCQSITDDGFVVMLDVETNDVFEVEFSGLIRGPRLAVPIIELPLNAALGFIKLMKVRRGNIYVVDTGGMPKDTVKVGAYVINSKFLCCP